MTHKTSVTAQRYKLFIARVKPYLNIEEIFWRNKLISFNIWYLFKLIKIF